MTIPLRRSGDDRTHAGRYRAGQSLVEFALVLPIFLLMLFGLIDVGRLVYANSIVSQAAREGARVAAVEAYWVGSTDPSCGVAGGPVCPAGVTGAGSLLGDVTTGANRMVVPFGPIPTSKVYVACSSVATPPAGAWTGVSCPATARTPAKDSVSVRVEMPFQALTPIISGLLGTFTLSGAATMTIN